MVRATHGTRHPRLFWQVFGWLFILTATMGMGDCGNNNPAVSIAPSGGSSGVVFSASLVQQAYVKASNAETSDNFGNSVALSGDTLVIGAPQEDSNATGVGGNQADNSVSASGAVYVLTRVGGVWTQQAYIKASNPGSGDRFGSTIALSGDTLVIGTPQEDSNATGVGGSQADNSASGSGAVYVLTRTGGVWTQQAYLKASNTGASDSFGSSLALSGDTLVVGAFSEDSNATGIGGNQADNSALNSGAAYVFTRTGGVWTQQAYLKASNTEASDSFGSSLALSGDTLAVGAPSEDSTATGVGGNQADNSANASGAVYVFTRTGGVWTQQAYLKASNTEATDNFGQSVALSGDTLAVGTPNEDSNATGVGGNQADNSASASGAAYVFTRTGGVWTQQAYLKASNAESFDLFGLNVVLDGDVLVVGALGEASNATGIGGNQADNSAVNSSAVYIFRRTGGLWAQENYVKASNTDAGDNFFTIALNGDTLVVGANSESSNATGVGGNQADNSAVGSGAVYIFQ